MKTVTFFVHPPIPDRSHDWTAIGEDYEPGDPIGWGATEAEAVADLAGQLADEADYRRDEDADYRRERIALEGYRCPPLNT
jgi:hypothetical protein